MRDVTSPGSDAANLEAMGEAVAYQAAMRQLVVDSLGLHTAGTCVLDFGAGRGDYAADIQRQQPADVLCLEPDRALHHHYPEGLPVVASLAHLRAGVDGAYSLNVFEHIEDDVGALRELARHCRPGACIFILVPANPKLWTAMDTLVGHRRRYMPDTLRAVVDQAGLALVDEGWFDRTGYFATRAYQLLQRVGLRGSGQAGAVSKLQIRVFDGLFKVLEPTLSRFAFGKNCWVLAKVPE
jgi:SAM-dependent methyltransferase